MEEIERNGSPWKLLALVLVVGLLAGLFGGVLSAQIFIKSGPQGEQGPQGPEGPQGEQGPVGPQGIPGTNGTDSILQAIQNRNDTEIDPSGLTEMQWYNISDFDPSMEITINVRQNSKIFAQFSSTQTLDPPASVWMRIVVDNNYNSSIYVSSVGPPASGTYQMAGHTELLTDALNEGPHAINAQFWIQDEPINIDVLDRTLTVMEIA